ncbi:MAG TPA: hypothetical protein VER33_08875, partial [Polyangiaceae bacterium]|nr:hypothetical protein [Polyangiaceae bacterium]
RVVRADVLLGARRVARVNQPPFQRAVSQRRLLRPRRERLLRVRAELRDGSRLTLDKRLAICR